MPPEKSLHELLQEFSRILQGFPQKLFHRCVMYTKQTTGIFLRIPVDIPLKIPTEILPRILPTILSGIMQKFLRAMSETFPRSFFCDFFSVEFHGAVGISF